MTLEAAFGSLSVCVCLMFTVRVFEVDIKSFEEEVGDMAETAMAKNSQKAFLVQWWRGEGSGSQRERWLGSWWLDRYGNCGALDGAVAWRGGQGSFLLWEGAMKFLQNLRRNLSYVPGGILRTRDAQKFFFVVVKTVSTQFVDV